MSACPQCGTPARPTDKFCNVCGTPVVHGAPAGQAAPPPFAAPPPYGASPAAPGPPGPRCQLGHEIAPGASYCAQGHPIALDQMQFAADAYRGGYGGGAAPPFAPQGTPYGAPGAAPPQAQPFGVPPPAQGPFGAQVSPTAPPPPYAPGPQAYGPPPNQGFGAPLPRAGQYGSAEAPADLPARILRGFLVAYASNPSGDFWPLVGGRLTVGRAGASDGLDIPLPDPTISSRHAVLVVDGPTGTITVEDTSSTNGTFVNDEHIGFNGRRDLRDGDRVRFGGLTTTVKVIGRV